MKEGLTNDLTGRQRIEIERQRQIDIEGWSVSHDDQDGPVVLEQAALCYRDANDEGAVQPDVWPWDAAWWKPKNRQRNLERAGALYQAAADAAERAQAYELRDNLLEQVNSCAILLDSAIASQPVSDSASQENDCHDCRTLPAGAYEALEGLQAQAAAATAMLPGQDKSEAREALKAAQAKMAENDEWTRKIVKALMSGNDHTTAVTADAAWLERTFADNDNA